MTCRSGGSHAVLPAGCHRRDFRATIGLINGFPRRY
jgi:hypothetical protein